jgi:hypothetical protein
MMRREILVLLGGYSVDMKYAEDYDLWQRLSCVTRLSNLQEVLVYLRKHNANVSTVHLTEHLQYCYQVSNRMISSILKEEVPVTVVQRLSGKGFQAASDVYPIADIVYRLYQTFLANDNLSNTEKRAIRRGTALQIFLLCRPWVKDIQIWRGMVRVCFFDPFLVLRIAEWKLCRLCNIKHRASTWSL